MSIFEALLLLALATIAAALLAGPWRDRGRDALIDPARTPDEVFRTRLANEITSLLAPIAGIKQDLDGHGHAVEALSETTAEQARRIAELNAALDRLERHVADLATLVAQFTPCETCPLRSRPGG